MIPFSIPKQPYPQQNLSIETTRKLALAAREIVCLRSDRRAAVILTLLTQNAILLAEVNEHRAARGFEPLQGYDIK